jgi:hypothetical protein
MAESRAKKTVSPSKLEDSGRRAEANVRIHFRILVLHA